MKNTAKLVSVGLLLAIGLWACQDQVIDPAASDLELEAAFAKGGKPGKPDPEPSKMWVGFLHPDDDPRADIYPNPDRAVDFSADPQLINAQVTEDGMLQFGAENYQLVLHFQDDLGRTDLPEGVFWCESEVCARGSGCQPPPPGEEFNLLQDLQTLSDDPPGGLTGELSGDSGVWGIGFGLTVGEGEIIGSGQYVLDTWNARATDHGEYPDGFESDGNDLTGYSWWRHLNTPVQVFRRDLDAKKNDIWTERTICGYFDPGSPYRGVTAEIFAKPDGG